jgi:hypothetical protein
MYYTKYIKIWVAVVFNEQKNNNMEKKYSIIRVTFITFIQTSELWIAFDHIIEEMQHSSPVWGNRNIKVQLQMWGAIKSKSCYDNVL